MINDLMPDVRFALRFLLRNPMFTLVAALTLALCIGANATIFSFVDTLLLRPLPYRDAERLVLVAVQNDHVDKGSLSFPDYRDVRTQNKSFESMTLALNQNRNLTSDEGEPERLRSLLVESNLFSLLGIQPMLGRPFLATDDQPGADRTVILSHAFWQRRFGGDRSVLGRNITLDGNIYQVIGVLPAALDGEKLGSQSVGDLWLPISLFFDRLPVDDRGAHLPEAVIGRLKPGVSLQQAATEMTTITSRLQSQYPERNAEDKIVVFSLPEDMVQDLRPTVLTLSVAVAFVLLITCANLAGLLLARAVSRPQEIALRQALGASRQRLIRQLMIENMLLALIGGAFGVLIAYWALDLLPAILPSDLPHMKDIAMNGRIMAFTALLTLITGVLFGLAPAVQTSRIGLQQVLARESGSRGSGSLRSQKLRNALVTVELALALVLLIGANLMIRSVIELQRIDTGFNPENVLTMRVSLPMSRYAERDRWVGYFEQAFERIGSIQGVRSVAATSLLPLAFGSNMSSIVTEEDRDAEDPPVAFFQAVSPSLFQTLGVTLVQGRNFTPRDDDRYNAPKVAIINESLARQMWPGQNPIGKRFSFEIEEETEQRLWREVIGIAKDVRESEVQSVPKIGLYVPYTQPPIWFSERWPTMAIVIKTEDDPMSVAQSARSSLIALDSNQPVFEVKTMEEILSSEFARPLMISVLLTSFAVLALVQAILGVYGIITFVVSQRRKEFGVRMALGAAPGQILLLVLRKGLLLAAVGALGGLAISFGLTRLIETLLYGVTAIDPLTFAGLTLALLAIAIFATLIPAWRATKINPSEALHFE